MDPSHDISQMGTQPELPRRLDLTYDVITEGAAHKWHSPTITVAQIRALAGWDVGQAVLEVDLDTGTETTPDPSMPVSLKPGIGFARKIRFTQGIG